MSTDATMLELADASLAESLRAHARWMEPNELFENDCLQLAAGVANYPTGPWNTAIALGTRAANAQWMLDHAHAFFARKKRSFSIYVREHLDQRLATACERAGYPKPIDIHATVISERVAAYESAKTVSLRELHDENDAWAFFRVAVSAYDTPLAIPVPLMRLALAQRSTWLPPHARVQLMFDGARVLAAALVLFSGDIAGVHWLGTLPQGFRHGCSEILLRTVAQQAFAEGARAVIAFTTSGHEHACISAGFRELTRYSMYVVSGAREYADAQHGKVAVG